MPKYAKTTDIQQVRKSYFCVGLRQIEKKIRKKFKRGVGHRGEGVGKILKTFFAYSKSPSLISQKSVNIFFQKRVKTRLLGWGAYLYLPLLVSPFFLPLISSANPAPYTRRQQLFIHYASSLIPIFTPPPITLSTLFILINFCQILQSSFFLNLVMYEFFFRDV